MEIPDQKPELVNATCSQCGYTRYTYEPDALCATCTQKALVARITPQLQAEIDAFIRQDNRLEAIKILKAALKCTLQNANVIVWERTLIIDN